MAVAAVVEYKTDTRQLDQANRKLRQVDKSATGAANSGGRIGTAFSKLGRFVGPGSVVAAAAAGMAVMAKNAANTAKELKVLSDLSNMSVEQFQRHAYAAEQVGIQQDKLADIYKDMQDRVGDFIQTGGGPMLDFFENIAPQVGVTAEQFAKLSGPEALKLFVKSLEEANVSQNDMTFYMEAIASDSARLLPLLKDNAEEFDNLAESASGVISEETINKGNEMNQVWADIAATISGPLTGAFIELNAQAFKFFGLIEEHSLEEVDRKIADALSRRQNFSDKLEEAGLGEIALERARNQLENVNDEIDRLRSRRAEITGQDPLDPSTWGPSLAQQKRNWNAANADGSDSDDSGLSDREQQLQAWKTNKARLLDELRVRDRQRDRLQPFDMEQFEDMRIEIKDTEESTDDLVDRMIERFTDLDTKLKQTKVEGIMGLSESIAEFAVTGEQSMEQFAKSFLEDMAKMIIQTQIFKAIAGSSFGQNVLGMGSGGAGQLSKINMDQFSGMRMAKGGVLGGPTFFNTNQGPAVAGEEGPEGVLPLARDSMGRLGVHSSGGNSGAVMIENINVTMDRDEDESPQEQSQRMAREIRKQLESVVDKRISHQQRPGNQLNQSKAGF